MKHSYFATGLLALATGGAVAQAPALTATVPARHVVTASRTAPVEASFSQAVTGADSLRLFGNQWPGLRTGTGSGNGSTTLRYQPRQVFAPGEEVSLTVPATVRGAGAGGTPLASGQVVQFRAAAGPATGTFVAGPGNNDISYSYFRGATLADVNHDGWLDLLYFDPTSSSALRVQLGDGTGQFGAVTRHYIGQDPNFDELVMTDVNRDGNLDILINALGGATRYVALSYGDGRGGFSRGGGNFPVTGLPVYAQTADVNADGYPDVLYIDYLPVPVSGSPATYTVLRVHLGSAQGTFSSLPAVSLPMGTGGLRVADADNDGRLDCLVANSATGQLTTYLGNGQGSFAAATTPALAIPVVTSTSMYPARLSVLPTVADFTGDGNVDVLVLHAAANELRLHPGTGRGDFGAATVLTNTSLLNAYAADLDSDGDLDIVTTSSASPLSRPIYYWRNTGSGSFGPPTTLAGSATQLAIADMNNDGTLDVLALDEFNSGNYPGFKPLLNQPLATAPTLTGFTPALAPAGTVVTLTGTNLAGATALTVGGVLIPTFTVDPATGTITFTVPAGTASGLVSVLTPTGTATTRTGLRTAPAPTITGFTPASAAVGATVTVSGTNLTGATGLTVGSSVISTFSVDPNTGALSFVVPAGFGGAIAITTLGGTVVSSTPLTVLQAPTITSFSPATAPANAPVTVTVTGTNLFGATGVTVGGVAVTGFTVNANGTLTFTLPAGSAGGVIAVTTPGGTVSSSTALTIVLSAPGAAAPTAWLYPNPAHDRVHLQLPAGPVQVRCLDALGRVVRTATATITASPLALDLHGLAPGRYVLLVQTATGAPRHWPLVID